MLYPQMYSIQERLMNLTITREGELRLGVNDTDPMWIGDRIWFASDRSGTLNLWSYDVQSKAVHQETSSTTWDIRWPSAGGPEDSGIVYQKAGELHWLDTNTGRETAIKIRVPDEGANQRPKLVDARGLIEGFALSPGGRRAIFAARGELLTAPREHGDVRNITYRDSVLDGERGIHIKPSIGRGG